MSPYSLHRRTFRSLQNSENGEVGPETLFFYEQNGTAISATYSGGTIARGALLGLMLENGDLDFAYHHLSTNGELRAGLCHSVPERMSDGRLRFHEEWQWTTGDRSTGNSIIEEVL